MNVRATLQTTHSCDPRATSIVLPLPWALRLDYASGLRKHQIGEPVSYRLPTSGLSGPHTLSA